MKITASISFLQKLTIGILLGSFIFIATFFPHSLGPKLGSQPLRLYFFDIGQGDSALIVTPSGQSILVDGGPDSKILERLDALNPYWNRRIDYLLLTHGHADHIAGLTEVLKAYEVKNILWNNVAFNSPYVADWVKQLGSFKGNISSFERGDVLKLGDVTLRAIWPPKDMLFADNINNVSIVTHLVYKNFDCLFTGDIEGDAQTLVDWPKNIEILKVPHHGGANDTSERLLKLAGPYVAVISVGDNTYGQPAKVTLDLLSQYGVDTYRTDEYGSVTVLSDGRGWWVGHKID